MVPPRYKKIDGSLWPWDGIAEEFQTPGNGILLGNGASLAIWPHYAYSSLYEVACLGERPLTWQDRQLFEQMETTNFEAILSALNTSRIVCSILEQDTTEIERRYTSIREALIFALSAIHLPHDLLNVETAQVVHAEIRRHSNIFTTNYDLTHYWCMMSDGEAGFKDYLWHLDFDPSDTVVWNPQQVSVVHYLHGSLHLYLGGDGVTRKRAGGPDRGSILRQIYDDESTIPLFISEGTAKDKMNAIRRNGYLSFAYEQFMRHTAPLVIFGHALSTEFDKHIIDAINAGEKRNFYTDISRANRQAGGSAAPHQQRKVAISIFPRDDEHEIAYEKARLRSLFKYVDLHFFDSTTHPLGDRSLLVHGAY